MKKPPFQYNPDGPWSTREELDWLFLLENPNADPKAQAKARELELAMCKEDPWRFLTYWCLTEDAQNEESPFQLFPNKIHLYWVTVYWIKTQYLLVPKSRQLSLTWLMCGLYLWQSLFFPSRLTMFQCKIEEDSKANLRRSFTIWEKLPQWMKDWQPCKPTELNLTFTRSRSQMIAVAQGSKHFRQRTLSGVFVDEASYSEDLMEVFGAAKSALGKVGKFTAVSSATPSEFASLVADESA